MSRILKPEPLTREAFAPFGDVIETAGIEPVSINDGATLRYNDLADVDCTAQTGSAIVSLFRTTPPEFPFTLQAMENHPLGTHALMPLSGRPYLVVVAPRGWFDPAAVRAFLARGDQGVNYARGTWHHFNLALGAPSDFLVIDRSGPASEKPADNCTGVAVAEFGLTIEAPDAP
jgi:ureidoglycolate lyase